MASLSSLSDIFPGYDIDFDADECCEVIFKEDEFEEADGIGKFHEHVNIVAAMGVAPHVHAKEPDPFNLVPVAEDLLVGADRQVSRSKKSIRQPGIRENPEREK